MILLCGIPSESPIKLVQEELTRLNIPHVLFNQRFFDRVQLKIEMDSGCLSGAIDINGSSYPMEGFAGVYLRLMDNAFLPELQNEPSNSEKRQLASRVQETLVSWCEIAPTRIINRLSSMASNSSKPYQSQIILRHGFAVPDTLITNDPEAVLEFSLRHNKIVYKSISGIRSIVQIFKPEDKDRLNSIRWCPTQFQQYIEGTNVRVHTIGSRTFATAIHTDVTDYRYANKQDGSVSLRETKLPRGIEEKCLSLAAALKLEFAGIDLKITSQNEVYCFEVNPSPAFSYYQMQTGQPIAECLAQHLAGREV